MDWIHLAHFAVALLAVLDPLGGVPVYMASTAEDSPGVRRGVAALLALFVFVVLLVFLLGGQAILSVFGITLAAFRVGGGVMLLMMGLRMASQPLVRDEKTKQRHEDAVGVRDVVKARFRDLVVPIGIPLLVGPGSIATVILYAGQTQGRTHWLGMVLVIAAVSAAVFVSLTTASVLKRLIGETGMAVSARLLGMLLVAIAAQFILTGLGEAFPSWMK